MVLRVLYKHISIKVTTTTYKNTKVRNQILKYKEETERKGARESKKDNRPHTTRSCVIEVF